MTERKRKVVIISLILNSLLIALELFGLSEVFFRYLPGSSPFKWYYSLTYYTNLSNIMLLIGASGGLAQDMLALKGKEEKKYLFFLKYLGVIVTMVTCLTVIVFMIMVKDLRYGFSVQGNMWLLLHNICPWLGLVSLLFFDGREKKSSYRLLLLPVIYTFLYTLMVEILYFTGGRIPYAADMDGSFHVDFWYILLCGIVEMIVSALIGTLVVLGLNKLKKIPERNS